MAEGDEIPHFKFWEEPLGLPADEGFGLFQGGPGDCLGPEGRFTLAAKIGHGSTSSVWLARDSKANRHVTVKILNGYTTQLNRENKLRELQVLQRLSAPAVSNARSCARLLDHFYLPGIEDDGEHLCLVTEFGGSLHFVRQQLPDEGYIPLPIAKRILRDVLSALAHIHSLGIAHTDIKPDNILVDLGGVWTGEAIEAWLKSNPPRTYKPMQSLNKMVTSYVTQKFPPPPFTLVQLASSSFKLSDFGSAQIVDAQTTDEIVPFDFRPPEIILGGEWDQSVDIWNFGCVAFHLLTRGTMFAPHPIDIPAGQASAEDVLLFQMVCYTGETFSGELLSRCPRTLEFFNRDGSPKKFEAYINKGMLRCVREGANGMMSEADMRAMAAFLLRCLRLDPKDRATAEELLADPWLHS
ncbi:kinase-like domain-containing protein [Sparassis latifolia]